MMKSIKAVPKAGRFLGYVGEELIVTSWQPFLDGVQALVSFSSRNRSDFS
jgi:hypothetical protein